MLRTFVVKHDTDFKSLTGTLLDARFGGAQADAAAAQLKALNPHADLDRIKAGTTIFIPDLPQFKPSAAASTQAGLVDDLRRLVSAALTDTGRTIRLAYADRTAARADAVALLKGAALRKIAGADSDIALQVENAQKLLAEDEAQDRKNQDAFAAVGKEALDVLAQMSKLVG